MNLSEKIEFLDYAKQLAMNLEEKTDEFIEIQIGWIEEFQPSGGDYPVTIMVNHPDGWFGSFEKLGWNEQVLFARANKFIPVKDPYLQLNDLITQAYNGGAK